MLKLIWGIIRSWRRDHVISVNYSRSGVWCMIGKMDCKRYDLLGVMRDMLSRVPEDMQITILEVLNEETCRSSKDSVPHD